MATLRFHLVPVSLGFWVYLSTQSYSSFVLGAEKVGWAARSRAYFSVKGLAVVYGCVYRRTYQPLNLRFFHTAALIV